MGGFFGVASKEDCVFDLFYGTDYHSHLGTKRAGLAVYGKEAGFDRAIHSIETTNFRPKFDNDILKMKGHLGIGCISDLEPQPLIVRSRHGTYALTTVGKINNAKEIVRDLFDKGHAHFLEMSGGDINPTELTAVLINRQESIPEGIRYAQETIRGSLTLLLMTTEGIYAARDLYGRTPVSVGKKEGATCACFESFAYLNLGYTGVRELAPGEIAYLTPEEEHTVKEGIDPDRMRICTFLWIYYGFPGSSYEGVSVEEARYRCGRMLAKRDLERGESPADSVTGIPDSGVAHAVGYAGESGIPYSRPFVKYTPTWPRSFMPTIQSRRDLIARMKLIPVHDLIAGRRLLMIDDSIVRGTQLRETTSFLYESGASEVHIRPACPPIVFSCKYLNFSRSSSEMELITRRMIEKLEGTRDPSPNVLAQFTQPDEERYQAMLGEIRKELNFTSLHYNRLDDMIDAMEIKPCRLCTYCWNGRE
ncbi:MAG: amidophosphoribosyltransferase [Lachnospiraceae bacterium]|nr:amidophosphoribosyltransferase [Lachnospiraceae bacterium]